jgi:hypothetical protein
VTIPAAPCQPPPSRVFAPAPPQEHQAGVPDAEAGEYFFHDLATAGDAASALITSRTPLRSVDVPGVPADAYRCTVVGEQAVAKGREGALNKVLVCMLVVRLPGHASEVLLTLNTPVFISEGSAAAERAGAGYKPQSSEAHALFARIAATLQIHDYGLFGGGGDG